jgi:hypothetical protein
MNTKLRDAEARHQNFVDEVKRTSTLWALAKGDGLAVWSDEEGLFCQSGPMSKGLESRLALFLIMK